MSSLATDYCNSMFKHFGGYRAAWMPGVPFELGDIGLLEDGVFRKISNLSALGVKFDTRPDPTPQSLDFASSDSVNVTFKAAGEVAPPGGALAQVDAGFSIDFQKERSTFFTALSCRNPTIADEIAVGAKIIELFRNGKWNRDWRVITELVTAESATVLISQGKSASVELKLKASAASGQVGDLAKVDAGLSIARSRNMHTQLVAVTGTTPLFRTRRVAKKIFGKATFAGAGKAGASADELRMLPLDAITPEMRTRPELASMLDFELDSPSLET